MRARYAAMEYPVVISYWAWWAAEVTQRLSGSPDLEARAGMPADSLGADPQVRKEMLRFVVVNALGFAALALLAAWLLAGVNPRRPWDAALLRGLPGAGPGRPGQLGPAGGGLRGRRAVGLGAGPAGAHRAC